MELHGFLLDFKKKDGYKRSIELSKEYGLLPSGLLRLCFFPKRKREKFLAREKSL